MLSLLRIQKVPSPIHGETAVTSILFTTSTGTTLDVLEVEEEVASVTFPKSNTSTPTDLEEDMMVEDIVTDSPHDAHTTDVQPETSDSNTGTQEIGASGQQQFLTSEADQEQPARSSFLHFPDSGFITVALS